MHRLAIVSLAVLLFGLLAGVPGPAAAHGGDDLGPPGFQCIDGPFGVPGPTGTPDEIGSWGAVLPLPLIGTHAVLLHTGKVLLWRGENEPDPVVPTPTYLWDPVSETWTQSGTAVDDLFCSGQSTLADGRVLVMGGGGGQPPPSPGAIGTNLYDPATGQWTQTADMNQGRWYGTVTTLPDGRALAMGGQISEFGEPYVGARIPEIYNWKSDTWTQLPGAEIGGGGYPRMFIAPDGRPAFMARFLTYLLDLRTQSWEVIDFTHFDSFVGGQVMVRPGFVLSGGGGDIQAASSDYEVIDLTDPVPAWRVVTSPYYPRRRFDFVLLPDGTVLSVGGSVGGQNYPECATHTPELWDPASETWTEMASQARTRVYHSSAVLLPDGRVLTAGGENNETGGEYNAEIYSPPYLFKGPRPVIAAAPGYAHYESALGITMGDSTPIASLALLRPAATTHNFDQNQRYVPLEFSQVGSSITATSPENVNFAPPGYYMLFAVDGNGVPSVASWLQLGSAHVPATSVRGGLLLGLGIAAAGGLAIRRSRAP